MENKDLKRPLPEESAKIAGSGGKKPKGLRRAKSLKCIPLAASSSEKVATYGKRSEEPKEKKLVKPTEADASTSVTAEDIMKETGELKGKISFKPPEPDAQTSGVEDIKKATGEPKEKKSFEPPEPDAQTSGVEDIKKATGEPKAKKSFKPPEPAASTYEYVEGLKKATGEPKGKKSIKTPEPDAPTSENVEDNEKATGEPTGKELAKPPEPSTSGNIEKTEKEYEDLKPLDPRQSEEAKIEGPIARSMQITFQTEEEKILMAIDKMEKMEEVFKRYTDLLCSDLEQLVFIYDGERLDADRTAVENGIEDDAVIDVKQKSKLSRPVPPSGPADDEAITSPKLIVIDDDEPQKEF